MNSLHPPPNSCLLSVQNEKKALVQLDVERPHMPRGLRLVSTVSAQHQVKWHVADTQPDAGQFEDEISIMN